MTPKRYSDTDLESLFTMADVASSSPRLHALDAIRSHIAALEAEIAEFKPGWALTQIRAGNFTEVPLPDSERGEHG